MAQSPQLCPSSGLEGGPGEGAPSSPVLGDHAQAHPNAGAGPGWPPTAPALLPAERFATTQVGSHGPGEVPTGSGKPSSRGSGCDRNTSRCVPQPHTLDCPAPSTILASHLLQEDPTLLPGVGKAKPGPSTAEGFSWKGPLESGGPQPQIHMNEDEVMEVTAGRRGGACVPSDRQGGSSQEVEVVRRESIPPGPASPLQTPGRPQEAQGML